MAINSGVSFRKAASVYGFPAATLGKEKNNPNAIKTRRGPETFLSKSEEDEIVNWMTNKAKRGMLVAKTELLDSVQKYLIMMQKKTPCLGNRPNLHWYKRFRKRHPQLTIRKPQHLSLTRASVIQYNLQGWFSGQEKYLKEKYLFEIASNRVFNFD